MGGRKRDKRRAPSPNVIRRSTPQTPDNQEAVLSYLHHLPLDQLHDFADSAGAEIKRLQSHVKQTQATIGDLQQMQELIVRLELQRTPVRDGAYRLPHAEVAVDVLTATGHPMQLKDLLVAMAARGAIIAGKNERQRRSNLIITLGRSPLVRRVGHGLYALTEARASA